MTLDRDDVNLAHHLLETNDYQEDPKITLKYEQEFAQWNGSKHAFAFMSGRVALSAAIHALDLQPGDEVILPGYTCVVVPNAFHFSGIETVYSDIELNTYGLDATQLESKITSKTRAILLHHLYGLVCRDYETILDIAKRRKLKVIEDCAQGTGAEYKGLKVGNRGDIAFYSSEQSKIYNTIQGGMATTHDDKLAERLKEYYDQAPLPDASWTSNLLHNVILNYYQIKHPKRYWVGDLANLKYGNKRMVSTTQEEVEGIQPNNYGMKMPGPIAALGSNQLKKVDAYNDLRRKTIARWDHWAELKGYNKPLVIVDSVPVFLRYPILVEPEKKKDLSWGLSELGLTPGVWFISPLHPSSQSIPNCPNSYKAVQQCINFPSLLN
jgi:dTDP-4-amino-4,6-dideoxygalactose transaminase